MKTTIVRCLLLALAFTGSMLAQNPGEAAPREVLVKFTSHVPAFVQDLMRQHDLDITKGIGGGGAMRLRSRSQSTDVMIRSLSQRPDVEFVEPNYIVTRYVEPTDTYWASLWGMAKISAPAAWDKTTGTRNIVVGVVDTGVDYTHSDLMGNIWSNLGSTVTVGGSSITCLSGTHGFNAIKMDCDPMDDNDHGTHVSGTIGATANNGPGVVGVNWFASIMGLKFLNAQGSGYTSDAIDAIEFAVQLKSNHSVPVRVLNNSWGGGSYSQALYDEIKRAGDNDILFVAAAGNSGKNTDRTPSYPASYNLPNIISVAATDSGDALASWSNYGAQSVDLAAPGVSILSTIPGNAYASYSGTSMATPHVSGSAALVLSASGCTGLTFAQVKAALLNNVDPVLAGKTLSGGRLNVGKAAAHCANPVLSDFAISATPASRNMKAGRSGSYTVTITPIGSFSGPVVLTGPVCPTFATCTLNPASASVPGNSTLTVSTARNTPLGTYTLKITGTGEGKTHDTTVRLVVAR